MYKMAAQSNTGFYHEQPMGSVLNRHAISFQSGAINSNSEMIPTGNYFRPRGMMLQGSSSMISNSPGMVQNANSLGSLLLDSVPGLSHDTGLAVEWSAEEQYRLEEGLVRFADEPSIMRYIKIAARMRDKTVRDVALRCRWMTRKRRKADEHAGKKVNNRKDKMVESSSKTNLPSASQMNVAAYSQMMHHMDQNGCIPCEAAGISGTTKHLLEQNCQALNQIASNLSTFKLQDNIDLFCHTRDNITAILNDMRDLPGIMRQMPPLPVSINEDLANGILPNITQMQSMMFGSTSGINLKQEQGAVGAFL